MMNNPEEYTEEEIKKLYRETLERVELIAKNADHHLTQVVRFLMWTCALSFGVIAWIATNFVSHNEISKILVLFGIVFIIDAIIIGVYVINQVFTLWELTWRSTNKLYQTSLLLVGVQDNPEMIESIRDTVKTIKDTALKRNQWMERFPLNRLLLIHLSLLGFGIGFYSITIFL
jgi:hypothetical protein